MPMLNSIKGVELFIAERGGQYGLPRCEVIARSLRGHCEVIASNVLAGQPLGGF